MRTVNDQQLWHTFSDPGVVKVLPFPVPNRVQDPCQQPHLNLGVFRYVYAECRQVRGRVELDFGDP
jgi:hypothetical protein